MADLIIVKEWIRKADDDLNFATINLEENHPFYSLICFHFHQSAEKYLKSYIVAYDLEFEKTHNLIALLKICANQHQHLLSLMNECERLNASYIDTRYPVNWPTDYTKEKALELKKDAETIARMIKEQLKKENHI